MTQILFTYRNVEDLMWKFRAYKARFYRDVNVLRELRLLLDLEYGHDLYDYEFWCNDGRHQTTNWIMEISRERQSLWQLIIYLEGG